MKKPSVDGASMRFRTPVHGSSAIRYLFSAWLLGVFLSLVLPSLGAGTRTGFESARAETLNAGLLAPATEPEPDRAGLVVQGQDGKVSTYCLNLGGETRSGLELLRMAGLDVALQSFGPGVAICSIGGEGCDYPAEPCWCECRSLSAGCAYWAYHTLEDGRWNYAALGPTGRRVKAGDVDGWAWGPGSLVAGAEPPVISFEEICASRASSPGREIPATATAEVRPRPPAPATATLARRAPIPIATKPPTRGPAGGATEVRPGSSTHVASPEAGSTSSSASASTPSSPSMRSDGLGAAASSRDGDGGEDAPRSGDEEGADRESSESVSDRDPVSGAASASNSEDGREAAGSDGRQGRSGEAAGAGESNAAEMQGDPDSDGPASLPFETLDLLAFLTVLGLLVAILVGARRA